VRATCQQNAIEDYYWTPHRGDVLCSPILKVCDS